MKCDFVKKTIVNESTGIELERISSAKISLCSRADVFEFLNKPKKWREALPWTTEVVITTPVKEFKGYAPIVELREGSATIYLHSLNDRRIVTLETYAVRNRVGVIQSWAMTVRNTKTTIDWHDNWAEKEEYSAPTDSPVRVFQGGGVSPR
ncbi:hypothetical protein [Vibrio parahaemolyticus]|uniref:hypothetical protein n=1 Tax=Vibrio parahaemolyticus TaxID=670 RepID=UPI00387B1E0E